METKQIKLRRNGIARALHGYDTGRWDWKRITCCMTSKDADLEPWANKVSSWSRSRHAASSSSFMAARRSSATKYPLNLTPEQEEDDEQFEQCRDAFLEQAQLVVCGTYSGYGNSGGDWTGDDWFLSFEMEGKVGWSYKNGRIDYQRTALRIYDAAQRIIKPWENEMILADKMMSQLAGWKDEKDENCENGKPSKLAAWRYNEAGESDE